MVDSSSGKCKDSLSVKDSLSSLHHFHVSPTSVQQSLFRLLHRCDQCISPQIRYYSSAQPHCRFFQAALGPVVFQTLCDWFKENPLAIAHESPAPRKKTTPSDAFVISPTKSPPPQIMRIQSDTDLSLTKLLNDSLSSIDISEQSVTINVTTLPQKANKSATEQDKVVLHSSIKPTQTAKTVQTSVFNVSLKASPSTVTKEVLPSEDGVSDQHTKVSVTVSDKVESPPTSSVLETATVTTTDYIPSNDVLSESEQQQFNELFSDASTVSSEDLSIEMVPATELPQTLKSNEEKAGDLRQEVQGKYDSAASAGSAMAGQKESVFMRMSNRIKALEINMSLSSQYLQELSQRYRRQMEEMQRAFNRTIGTLNDTARKAAEKVNPIFIYRKTLYIALYKLYI